MIDLKPYGAFIEHTIRPLLSEFNFVLDECDLKGIDLNKLFNNLVIMYIIHLVFELVKVIGTTYLICQVLLKVLAF